MSLGTNVAFKRILNTKDICRGLKLTILSTKELYKADFELNCKANLLA